MFDNKILKNRNIRNEFIRSSTNEFYFTKEGEITNDYLDYYEELAKNEVGIILSGHAFVNQQGRASVLQLNPTHEHNKSKLSELTQRVHEHKSLILMQLAHAGPKAKKLVTGFDAIGPNDEENCKGMDDEDKRNIITSFINAAIVAEDTGFDGIQVHCAHGYLLSSFIDENKNKRKDEYGGTIENRLKLIVEIIDEIKKNVSKHFMIAVKIDADTTSSEDFIQMGKYLEEAGVDLIEVSGIRYSQLPRDEEAYWLYQCIDLKKNTNVAVAIVGGIYTKECAERCLRKGIDFISLSRPLISEIDLLTKWKNGEISKSRCIRCGQCFSNNKVCVFNKD